MLLLGKRAHAIFVIFSWAAAIGAPAVAQNSYAVVRIVNATGDVTISYRFAWGRS